MATQITGESSIRDQLFDALEPTPTPAHSQSMTLFRAFIEGIIEHGRAARAERDDGTGSDSVDWDEIWSAGHGAPTVESAIGSIVTTAFTKARDMAGPGDVPFVDQAFPPLEATASAPPVAVPPVAPAWIPPPPPPAPEVRDAPAPPSALGSEAAVPWADADLAVATDTSDMTDQTAQVFMPLVPVPETADLIPPDVDDLPSESLRVTERREHRPARAETAAIPRWATIFTWVRNVGLIILLFVAWQLWGTSIAQHHEQGVLKSEFETSVKAHKTAHGGAAAKLIAAGALVNQPAEGSVVGHLQIPAIGVDQYVVSGTATDDLAKGPGHYIGTAMPGQAGNVAIAGHRTTDGAPFNELGHLTIGDKIDLTSLSGQQFTYSVSQPPVPVSPTDTSVLSDFGDNRITLTTCNPEYSAAQRLIVVGKLVQGVRSPTARSKPVTYHVVNPATASWRWNEFPIVGAVLIALILLGLANRRLRAQFGPVGQWIILTPIWLAGLYLLFVTLTSFLPASF
jgi:sortase A